MAADIESLELIIGAQMDKAVADFKTSIKTRMITLQASGMSRDAAIATLTAEQGAGASIAVNTYKNAMKNLTQNAVRGASNAQMMSRYEQTNVELFRWVTVSGNPCPQCLSRQGELLTLRGWQEAGFPKSGFSVCDDNCKCILVPEGFESPALSDAGFLVTLPKAIIIIPLLQGLYQYIQYMV